MLNLSNTLSGLILAWFVMAFSYPLHEQMESRQYNSVKFIMTVICFSLSASIWFNLEKKIMTWSEKMVGAEFGNLQNKKQRQQAGLIYINPICQYVSPYN